MAIGATAVHSESSATTQPIRQAWISAIVLLAVVLAGGAIWLATVHQAHAPGTAGSLIAVPPTKAPPLPLGTVYGAHGVAERTGPVTLSTIQSRHVVYDEEQVLLRSCGGHDGDTEVLVGSNWGMSGSVFACRDGSAADTVLHGMAAVEIGTLGLNRATDLVPGVATFHRSDNPGNPHYPAQLHLRYRSGNRVIGLVIQASTMQVATASAHQVLAVAQQTYPVTR